MKITHNKVGQNLNLVDGGNKADKAAGLKGKSEAKSPAAAGILSSDESGSSAKVDVSERAQEAKRIKELAMAAPDIDMAKVDKFRRLIDEGKYKVDSEKVADRMVDAHLETQE